MFSFKITVLELPPIGGDMGTMTKPQSDHNQSDQSTHYQRPDWFTRNVMNRVLRLCMRLGISVWGSRVLEHRGRRSGQLHHVPVNVLTVGGRRYLVSPRGETEWVRNVRAAQGDLVLQLGRKRQQHTTVEVPAEDRVPILRAYLQRWGFEVGMFFGGVSAKSTDTELAAIASRHPVFILN
jgi:deazaflavin-dependent oxidoreductase (nitroreductase family)